MENFKFILISIIVLVLVIFAGYWGFSTIESGSAHRNSEELKELTDENEDLKKEILDLNNEVAVLQSQVEKQEQSIQEQEELATESTQPASYKYQTLINGLQKLVDDGIYMKKGSLGTRVGTVQEFLNIYNKTSSRIDNDYGPAMETAIKKFQKDQGLTSDGEAGLNTFRKMVDWLKKQ